MTDRGKGIINLKKGTGVTFRKERFFKGKDQRKISINYSNQRRKNSGSCNRGEGT